MTLFVLFVNYRDGQPSQLAGVFSTLEKALGEHLPVSYDFDIVEVELDKAR